MIYRKLIIYETKDSHLCNAWIADDCPPWVSRWLSYSQTEIPFDVYCSPLTCLHVSVLLKLSVLQKEQQHHKNHQEVM